MAVIRQDQAVRLAQHAVALDLGDLRRQGEAMLARARQQAEQVLQDAAQERQRLIATAREDGLAQGREQGLREGREQGRKEGRDQALAQRQGELSALQTSWRDALTSFEQQRDHLLSLAREDVLELAVLLARRVIRAELRADPAAVGALVHAALEHVMRSSAAVVRVHPQDLTAAREVLAELMRDVESASHVRVMEDPALSRGSCVVRTPAGGEVDASLTTQLDRIAQALLAPDRVRRVMQADTPVADGPAASGSAA